MFQTLLLRKGIPAVILHSTTRDDFLSTTKIERGHCSSSGIYRMSTNLLASCANCVIESFKGVKTLIFTLYLVAYNIFSLLHCLREDIFSAVISVITQSYALRFNMIILL